MSRSPQEVPSPRRSVRLKRAWLAAAAVLYTALAAFQLGLPGLHYDEAKEAGLNALELLTGAPVTAFRGATVNVFGLHLPLMVQDYIGALNVYLALPLLQLTGIGVPNLRALPLLTGLVALLLLERTVSEWVALDQRAAGGPVPLSPHRAPMTISALMAVTLLAAAPSFIFWSRQGIFVTNLTQPLTLLCLWQGIRWLRTGARGSLPLSALAGGLALYAKLLAIWVIGPFVVLAGGWWLWRTRQGHGKPVLPTLSRTQLLTAVAAFALGVLPLLLFNWQTGGTLLSVTGNLQESYYGVDNRAIGANLPVRLAQLGQVLRGDQFWYLGGSFANHAAPWLAAAAVIMGLGRRARRVWPALALVTAAVLMSLFTVSDLFVTHYALPHPLLAGCIGLALGLFFDDSPGQAVDAGVARGTTIDWPQLAQWVAGGIPIVWLVGDLTASSRYHAALTRSGGLAGHSDGSYKLAYYLRYNGLGAPVALDWGFDAPIRYLSQGTVAPIELFGYASPAAPDPDFAQRLALFVPNPDNVYLLHPDGQTAFHGRREQFFAQAAAAGFTPQLEAEFSQRDGAPLAEIWRLHKP